MKLNTLKFGMAMGIFWGGTVLVFTLISVLTGFGYITLSNLSIYPWYQITVGGAFIGMAWGFVDGFIGAAIFAWLYNKLLDSKCCGSHCYRCDDE